MNAALRSAAFKRHIVAVVSDRPCGALDKARAHGVRAELLQARDGLEFSDALRDFLRANEVDYVLSFYTRLFRGALLLEYADRIINFHPSLLPSFKGLNGFDDTLAYGARFIGTTVHFIDEKMDEGKIIMQTTWPADPAQSRVLLRHRVFVQQCKSLLQIVRWLADRRLVVRDGRATVLAGIYTDPEFSPTLDDQEAIEFTAQLPQAG